MKQKLEPVTVVKKERRRNFTAEEVQVIMQEAGKNTTVIKGRFTPTITSETKEKVWISITKSVNSINGKGEGNGGMFGRNRSTPHALQGRSSATLTRSSERLAVAQAQHPSQQGRKPCYRQYSRNNGPWNSSGNRHCSCVTFGPFSCIQRRFDILLQPAPKRSQQRIENIFRPELKPEIQHADSLP